MTTPPLVTVIIPAYNVEDFVADAVESALAQTYPAVEIVVVDDGSTDGTARVLEQFGDRITVVHQENRGLAGARNSGLRIARGEYVGLLDADDLWLPHRLDTLVARLESDPAIDIVTSDSWVMEDFTPTERRSYVHRRRRPFPASIDDQVPEIARCNFLFIGAVFRRSLLDREGLFHEGPRRGLRGSIEGAEDYDLWTRFIVGGSRVGYVDEPLGYYRERTGQLSTSPQQKIAHQVVLERHLPDLWALGARGVARDLYEIGSRLAAQGERRRAARFMARALRAEGAEGQRLRFLASGVRRLVVPVANPTKMDRAIADQVGEPA